MKPSLQIPQFTVLLLLLEVSRLQALLYSQGLLFTYRGARYEFS